MFDRSKSFNASALFCPRFNLVLHFSRPGPRLLKCLAKSVTRVPVAQRRDNTVVLTLRVLDEVL